MRMFFAVLALCASVAYGAESRATRTDLTSQPEGANVIIDGTLRGVTPLTLFDVAPGRHHVKFTLDDYEEADEFFTLEEGGFAQRNAALAPLKGLLLVTSEPSGCSITLDGLSLGDTPRLITSLDAKNTYRLQLQKPGFQPRTIEVRFQGRTPVVKHEKLIVDSGAIEITSDPAGAEVSVNGLVKGVTPLMVKDVPKGRATITFRKDGYAEETRELSMVAGEKQTLSIRMTGLPGTLMLTAIPDTARFYVNDKPEGKGPITLSGLKPGEYRVRAELDGFGTLSKTIVLGNGESASEEFKLENVMGRIEVKTNPPGAQILLDGRNLGSTKSASGADVSDVFSIENVMAGEHTLVVRLDGYGEVTRHPKVENQKTAQANIRLKRIFKPNIEIQTDSGSYKGVLISNTPAGFEIEVSVGVSRVFPKSIVRKVTFLD